MPNLGGPELIMIVVVLLLLFGAKKLPELGSSVGKSIKNFKRGIEDANAEDEERNKGDKGDKRADADDEPVNSAPK
jgi:sec-independent protein translocase protein TatA